MHFNGLKLSSALEEFTIWKNQPIEENKRFECIFVLSNLSTGEYKLEKHQTLDILLMTDFSGLFFTKKLIS